ncbi:MAG: DMT family transporter [Parachlamydiales bacterium]|jgi:drug/metabolite transporter (DMT)-like permease
MFKGIVFAIAACFIWGLIYVVPQFMNGFTSIEVVLGRYSMYGLISSLIFLKSKIKGTCSYPRAIWIKALFFSLIITIGYYTFVVLSLRFSSPAICTLVLGISPIAIAFYGNWKQKETSFKSLIIPSFLILIGLLIINSEYFEKSDSLYSYILGIVCCILALIAWSWYVVANSRFLKQHPEIRSSDWSTLVGLSTLFWVFVFIIFLTMFFKNQFHFNKFFVPGPDLTHFLIGSILLGLLCSWVGAYLWNKASLLLPVSLAGQLTIFETIFGILFVYIIERHRPPIVESLGVIVLIAAIVYGVRGFYKNKTFDNQLTPD